MINIIKYRLLFFFLALCSIVQAQVPMSHTFKDYFIPNLEASIFPLSPFVANSIQDSVFAELHLDNKFTKTWVGRKLFNENLFDIQEEEYRLVVNPLAGFHLGRDNQSDDIRWKSTRGIQILGRLGDNFAFYTDVYENQALFTPYIHQYIQQNDIVPGQGGPKVFKTAAWDYSLANGFVSFNANKFINFQLGHGKHFWGNGYRSLLLSDNSLNYPYLRINTKFWKIQYINLFTQMLDIKGLRIQSDSPVRKFVSSHYLDIEVLPKLHFALFESVVYRDSTSGGRFDINYLNPFIFYRPIEFATGSSNGNVILGLNANYQLTKNQLIYAQFILDELKVNEFFGNTGWWANKYGIQFGIKSSDTFVPNLFVQSEVNYVRPYTYTHRSNIHNYGHYNQALAHPLSANFIESVSHIRYRYKRWFAETELMYAVQGRDFEDTNWGSDIYESYNTREQEFGNEVLQGNRTSTFYSDTKIGYIVNPSTNLRLELGYIFRKIAPEVPTTTLEANTTHYFHIGLVSRINNHYYDF